jgi:hypothetical protein
VAEGILASFGFRRRIAPPAKPVPPEETKAVGADIAALLQPWAERQGYGKEAPGYQYEELLRVLRMIEEEEARARAEAILLDHLNSIQRKDWIKHKRIKVQGQRMTYEVHPHEVYVIGGVQGQGRRPLYLCVGPTAPMPPADRVLATKLMIEGAEEHFLSVANPESSPYYHLRSDGSRTEPRAHPLGRPLPDALDPRYGFQFLELREQIEAMNRQTEATRQGVETVNQTRARAQQFWRTTNTNTNTVDATTFGDITLTAHWDEE